jgi:hypothetical protein
MNAMKSLVVAAICFLSSTTATCAYEQVQAENRAASGLALRMTLQLNERPDIVFSNIQQALDITNVSELVHLEGTFDQFGTNRGYENSVLEKYVFMPPGVVADDGMGGDIVIMGARPFPNADGTLMRVFVARLPDRFRGFTQNEAIVKRWLAKAGVEIPKPAPSEPIPRLTKEMTAEEWDRENRHWIDPILETALNSGSPPLPSSHAGSRGVAQPSPGSSMNTVSEPETISESSSRSPRWAMLAVGTLLLSFVIGTWLAKRRG